ncbi:hypothetical protein Tco_0848289 [Tanacetum coccineum]
MSSPNHPTSDIDIIEGVSLEGRSAFWKEGDLEAAFEYPGGSPAGIHGLFSGWYCGLASMKVTLRVSMVWDKGVTTGTLVRYETSCSRLPGNHVEDVDVRKSG